MSFNVPSHYDRWNAIQRAQRKGDIAKVSALIAENMPLFRESTDDLRLLFYIGFHCDEAAYREAMQWFTEWKTTPPDRYDYRCNAFVYAVTNTIPPKVQEAKPYLVPLFCETVGYVANAEPQAPTA